MQIEDQPQQDPEYCEKCGHFHLERTSECPDPKQPCGDYRCCVN
jgi:hypothetical protein